MFSEMCNPLQAEQTIAIRKRKFLSKFSVIIIKAFHLFGVDK